MKCYVVKDLLPEYIEKLCNEETAKDIETHIATCKKCQEILQNMDSNIQMDTSDEDIHPFAKIQKKIKREKRKKCLLILGLTLFTILFVVLGFFQAYPFLDGPNYDKIIYSLKAKSIAKALVTGNTEVLLNGVNNTADFVNQINMDIYQNESDFYSDINAKLQELHPESFGSKNYKVKINDVTYDSLSYYATMLEEKKISLAGVYDVYMDLISDEQVISISIFFFSKDAYIVMLNDCEDEDSPTKEFFDYNAFYYETLTGGYGNHTWFLSRVLAPERELNDYTFNLFSRQFTRDCMNSMKVADLNEGERELLEQVEGEQLYYEEIVKCSDYYNQIRSSMYPIYENSETVSVQLDSMGYNTDQNCVNAKLFWELKDTNGNNAIMVKEFLYGPYGYEAKDDTEMIYHDEGFDPELIQRLEQLFD